MSGKDHNDYYMGLSNGTLNTDKPTSWSMPKAGTWKILVESSGDVVTSLTERTIHDVLGRLQELSSTVVFNYGDQSLIAVGPNGENFKVRPKIHYTWEISDD